MDKVLVFESPKLEEKQIKIKKVLSFRYLFKLLETMRLSLGTREMRIKGQNVLSKDEKLKIYAGRETDGKGK